MGRTLHLSNPPMKGPDVLALQTALAAAKLYAGELDTAEHLPTGHVRYHGPGYNGAVAHACEVAKFRLGYAKSQIHPHHETADPTLTALLQGHAKLSAAQKLRRRKRLNLPSAEQAKRAASVAYWTSFLIPNANRLGYAETRPMVDMNDLEALDIDEDCSTACTKDNKAADLPDPNGLFYSGEGFTGTMLKHLRRIARHQVQIADKVVFVDPNDPAGHHVCTVLELLANGDMVLGSNGRPVAPESVLLSVEAAAQASMGATEIHFLQVAA